MMSINLKGGLGNQLFMIYSLMGISKKNNYEYLIDKQYNDKRKTYWNNILSHIPNCENINSKIYGETTIINENRYSQYMDIEIDKNEVPNILLNGYFQSFYYFENIRDEVFESILKQSSEITNKVDKIYNELKLKYKNKQLVFIHRRKTDYKDKIHGGYFQVLPMSYYEEALKQFDENECAFIIFSDEQSEALNEFEFLKYKEFIIEEDFIELLLMSKMDAAIIANSTFSAWGAYLMDYHRCKTIVCPKYWFSEWDIHRFDCFEKHWNFIENEEMFRNIDVDPMR